MRCILSCTCRGREAPKKNKMVSSIVLHLFQHAEACVHDIVNTIPKPTWVPHLFCPRHKYYTSSGPYRAYSGSRILLSCFRWWLLMCSAMTMGFWFGANQMRACTEETKQRATRIGFFILACPIHSFLSFLFSRPFWLLKLSFRWLRRLLWLRR